MKAKDIKVGKFYRVLWLDVFENVQVDLATGNCFKKIICNYTDYSGNKHIIKLYAGDFINEIIINQK